MKKLKIIEENPVVEKTPEKEVKRFIVIKKSRKEHPTFDELFKTGLSEKAKMFVEFYCGIDNGNGSSAARRAGFSRKNAGNTACQLLRNPVVQDAIRKRRLEVMALSKLKEQDILRELGKQVMGDVRNLFDCKNRLKIPSKLGDNEASLITGVKEIVNSSTGIITRQYTLVDKGRAVVEYGKHLGMFVEIKKEERPTDFNLTIIPAEGKTNKEMNKSE